MEPSYTLFVTLKLFVNASLEEIRAVGRGMAEGRREGKNPIYDFDVVRENEERKLNFFDLEIFQGLLRNLTYILMLYIVFGGGIECALCAVHVPNM